MNDVYNFGMKKIPLTPLIPIAVQLPPVVLLPNVIVEDPDAMLFLLILLPPEFVAGNINVKALPKAFENGKSPVMVAALLPPEKLK